MSRSRSRKSLVLVCLLLALAVISAPSAAQTGAKIQSSQLSALPLIFEKNQGQASAEYQFLSRRDGIQTYYFADGIDVFVPQSKTTASRLQLRWNAADPQVSIDGESQLPGRSNYFRGNDPSHWLRGVPQFAQVRYQHLYPGIDALFHGTRELLEHDFIVHPAADPSQIAFRANYPARLTSSGDLEFDLGSAKIHLRQPVAYQELAGTRQEVPVNYILTETGEVRFALGDYDHTQTLVIDPVFVFSTYFTGSALNTINVITTDPQGNVYITGSTSDPNFPITNGSAALCTTCVSNSNFKETYISKLDPTGHTLLYSAYLSGSEALASIGTIPSAMALDKNGNIVVAGTSSDQNFPLVGAVKPLNPPSFNHAPLFFVASLKPDGSALNYCGLVGGIQGLNSLDPRLALDSTGNAYLTGSTYDADFQLTPGTYDSTPAQYPDNRLFLLKLDTTGKLVYSTLVPGNVTNAQPGSNTNNFTPSAIKVDSLGQATIAGTGGAGLPATQGVLLSSIPPSPFIDPRMGFVLQLNSTASALNFASYLPGVDEVDDMTVDPTGNFYLTGTTSQANLPVTANAFQKTIGVGANCTCNDGFILKIDAKATKVLAATYLGGTPTFGNGGTLFTSIALDSKLNVLVGGATASSDFPLKNPFTSIHEFGLVSGGDLVVAQLKTDLSSLLFGSFLNSTELNQDSGFGTLAVDAQDKVFVAGQTASTVFPTTPNSYQPTTASSGHSFLAKLDLATAAPSACLNTDSITFGSILVNTPTSQTIALTNCGNAPLNITGISASLPSVTDSQSCSSIVPGSNCQIQFTFTPTTTETVSGTITISTNAPVTHRFISFVGKGGTPTVFYPTSISVSDLLVGTTAEFPTSFQNIGDGAWLITKVTLTGDFTLGTPCPSSVPGYNPADVNTFAASFCYLGIVFSPKAAGVRQGTLTITDNVAGSPHVIPITGNGTASYPTPSITSIVAQYVGSLFPNIVITGTNFFPASQVKVNGSTRTTHYVNSSQITADPLPSDISTVTEFSVTVTNPTPGGGTSPSFPWQIYAAIRNLQILNSVFEPHSGLLYVTTSAQSASDPGKVVVIDPGQAKIVNVWSVGNGPNPLAVSDDGSLLYVGLNGDKKVAQVALPAGTINLSAPLPNDPSQPASPTPLVALALFVQPGHAHTWFASTTSSVCEPCGFGVYIFDDATARPTSAPIYNVSPGELLAIGTDLTALYGASFPSPPFSQQGQQFFFPFVISDSGVTTAQYVSDQSGNTHGPGRLDTDGELIYDSNNEILDPKTLIPKGSFPVVLDRAAIRFDAPAGRIYYSGFPPADVETTYVIQSFDFAKQQLLGTITFGDFADSRGELFRYADNGLILVLPQSITFFRSSLVGGTSQFGLSSLTPQSIVGGGADLTLKISGTAFVSADKVSANATALQSTFVSATEIDAVVPASLLKTSGSLLISVTTPASKTSSLFLTIAPPAPAASVSPASISFDPAMVGSKSAAQNVTISNTGTAALHVSNVTVSGDYSQTNNCTAVAPGANCTVAVLFQPTAPNSREGTLTIEDDDASTQQTVGLHGTGTDVQITPGSTGSTSTVAAGQPANYALTIAPAGGFTGAVTFSCTSLPKYAACAITPPTTTLSTAPVNVAVTITTSQTQAASLTPLPIVISAGVFWIGLLLVALLLPLRRTLRQSRFATATALVTLTLCVATFIFTGCGGGSSSGSTPPPPQSTTLTTPQGTYTVNFVVTSQAGSRTMPLTLTVQ